MPVTVVCSWLSCWYGGVIAGAPPHFSPALLFQRRFAGSLAVRGDAADAARGRRWAGQRNPARPPARAALKSQAAMLPYLICFNLKTFKCGSTQDNPTFECSSGNPILKLPVYVEKVGQEAVKTTPDVQFDVCLSCRKLQEFCPRKLRKFLQIPNPLSSAVGSK